jgi:dextranase
MFALGGDHLELGEHMLGKEYFPNNNLTMSTLLKTSLVSYYDFIVAYQNILRDGGSFNNVSVYCTNSSSSIEQWPPQTGKVISLGKKSDERQVIHLFNFKNATHLSWRDLDGTQAEPLLVKSMPLRISTSQSVKKLWVATPDSEGSLYEELDFTSGEGYISFVLPALKYWTMIVLDL